MVKPVKKKKSAISISGGLKYHTAWFPLILLIPALFNFILFWCYPNFNSVVFAFTEPKSGEFTFNHFRWVWSNLTSSGDGIFAIALRNTLIYFTVGYFGTQTFNVVLAYFLYKKIPGHAFFRTLFYLPNMFAGIIMVSIYKNMIGPEGPIITFLYNHGFIKEQYMLLNTVKTAMGASVGFSLWLCVGGVFLWCTGAMARIPKDLLEAAALDGITPFKEFLHIVLPMISGTLSTLYIIGISGLLGAGGATLYLTYGEYETTTLSFWLWQQVYEGAGTGTTSALGLMMSAVSIPLVFFVKWLAGKLTAEVSY